MTVTKSVRTLISNRFRDSSKPKINQSQLAEYMGYGKSWVSKLMTGKLQTLTDDQVDRLEEFLGIRLQAFKDAELRVSPMAIEISRRMEVSAPVGKIIAALLEIEDPVPLSPRWIDTQDMTKIGQEIIRIAFANEDKPGKVARLILELLT